MSLEFYFLRSSEQKIVTDMLYYSQHLHTTNKTLQDIPELTIYHEFYGLTPKDFGIYILKDAKIAGAIWSRRLSDYHNSHAFVKNDTPVLNLAVKPEFQHQEIATALVEKYLQEAASMYEMLSISVIKEQIPFFQKFAFEIVEGSEHKSYVGDIDCVIMIKKLQKQSTQEHFTDFSDCKWLD